MKTNNTSFTFLKLFAFFLLKVNWRGDERDSFTNSLRYTTMNNAEFLSRLSSRAYGSDKTEMRFHLKKSVFNFRKKNYRERDQRNIHRIRSLVPANVCFKKTKNIV